MKIYPDFNGFVIRAEPDNLLEQEVMIKWFRGEIALKKESGDTKLNHADRLYALRFEISTPK